MNDTTATPTPANDPQVTDPEIATPEQIADEAVTPIALLEDFEARLRAEWPGPHNTTTGEYFVAPEVSVGGWAETLILQATQVAGEVFLGLTEVDGDEDSE